MPSASNLVDLLGLHMLGYFDRNVCYCHYRANPDPHCAKHATRLPRASWQPGDMNYDTFTPAALALALPGLGLW
jgi:hypothetical protein